MCTHIPYVMSALFCSMLLSNTMILWYSVIDITWLTLGNCHLEAEIL